MVAQAAIQKCTDNDCGFYDNESLNDCNYGEWLENRGNIVVICYYRHIDLYVHGCIILITDNDRIRMKLYRLYMSVILFVESYRYDEQYAAMVKNHGIKGIDQLPEQLKKAFRYKNNHHQRARV